jgi:NAD(P)-dependent dehydrogenase (short-subunit alcohol dehydrogenase family)
MRRYLITGANRGIGLELTRQLLARGDEVVACCRNPAEAVELRKIAQNVRPLDVSDPNSIAVLPGQLESDGLEVDVLINNAGVAEPSEALGELDATRMARVLLVNSISPVLMAQALAPWLEKVGNKPQIFCISSVLGSLTLARESGYGISYPMSKAALNMGVRQLALRLRPRGIAVVALHPGWVQTDMGTAQAKVKPADSVQGLLRVMDGASLEDSGRYLTFEGEELPW